MLFIYLTLEAKLCDLDGRYLWPCGFYTWENELNYLKCIVNIDLNNVIV
jgi:hypothetical protein